MSLRQEFWINLTVLKNGKIVKTNKKNCQLSSENYILNLSVGSYNETITNFQADTDNFSAKIFSHHSLLQF